jgi:hypothetical protein
MAQFGAYTFLTTKFILPLWTNLSKFGTFKPLLYVKVAAVTILIFYTTGSPGLLRMLHSGETQESNGQRGEYHTEGHLWKEPVDVLVWFWIPFQRRDNTILDKGHRHF